MSVVECRKGLSGTEMLAEDAAAVLMDVPLERMVHIRTNGFVLALDDEEGHYIYPKWQFDYDGQPYDMIGDAIQFFQDPWLTFQFMSAHHEDYGGQTGNRMDET